MHFTLQPRGHIALSTILGVCAFLALVAALLSTISICLASKEVEPSKETRPSLAEITGAWVKASEWIGLAIVSLPVLPISNAALGWGLIILGVIDMLFRSALLFRLSILQSSFFLQPISKWRLDPSARQLVTLVHSIASGVRLILLGASYIRTSWTVEKISAGLAIIPLVLDMRLVQASFLGHHGQYYGFFDLTVDDKHAGRLVFKLFNAEVPEATRRFCNLVTGKYGLGYKGSIFQPTNDALTCVFLPTDDKRFTTYGEACTGSPLKPNACALGAGPDSLLICFVSDSLLQTGYRPIGEILSGSHIVRRLIKFPEDTFIVVASCGMVFAPDGDDPA